MPNQSLIEELRRLRRGRGVRRPQPDRWIGPELRLLVESAYGPASGEQLRENLIALLRKATMTLPGDRRSLYQAALDASDLGGLLNDRLERLVGPMDRTVRTLQRYLNECDQLIAGRLMQDEQLRQAEKHVMRRGWMLDQFSSRLRLDLPQPEYHTTRTIQVTAPQLTMVTDVFSMPDPEPDQVLEVEAGQGCTLDKFERISSSMWRVFLNLPRPLTKGDTWDLSYVVRVSFPRQVPPYVVIAPARPCAAFSVRVDVGDSGAVDFVKLEGVPLPMLEDPSPMGVPLPVRDGTVSYAVSELQSGLAYGVHWRWSD